MVGVDSWVQAEHGSSNLAVEQELVVGPKWIHDVTIEALLLKGELSSPKLDQGIVVELRVFVIESYEQAVRGHSEVGEVDLS